MHRAQQKGIQEQQGSDEEASSPSPAPTPSRLRVAGPSNPRAASSLSNAHLGKRKDREVETTEHLPPYKRPRTNQNAHISPKPSVWSAEPPEPGPPNQPSTRPCSIVSAQPAQPFTHGLASVSSPSKCSTPVPLPHNTPLPIPTSKRRALPAPLSPAIIHQSPTKPGNNSANDQPSRTSVPTRRRAEFVDIDLSLEFSGDEQGDEQKEQEAGEGEHPIISGSRRDEIQSANGDEDSDKTEPDTEPDQDGSETNDDSQLDDSYVSMETQDYAMPWRRCLSALLSPPHNGHPTSPIQRGNMDQVLVPPSQSTNSRSTGNSNSQASAQQPQLRLPHQREVGPSRNIRFGISSAKRSPSPHEREMDPDTSFVPDSQDDLSLLGPPPRLPVSSLPQPEQLLPVEDKPLPQPSQPSQLTDPDFTPGSASFDEYTDPLEFVIGVREASLELKDEVDLLGQVVHDEDVRYVLRDRERIRRSESGASTRTDTTTLVGDYFEAKEEEIKKEMEEPQESQLTRTADSQGLPSQPLASESQVSQPLIAPAPALPGPSKPTSAKLRYLPSRVKALSSVQEERKKGLVVAVLDLIAHWLRITDAKLVHDIWDSLPLHEQTFDRVLTVCLQCDLTAMQTTRRYLSQRRTHIGRSGEDEDTGEEEEKPIGVVGLRQRYLVVPDPKRRFPYPKGRDPGHAWTKVICRMLGAMYGFKAQYVHRLWTETGGDVCDVERQLEGRETGWLDLRRLGLGDVPRPWI
jgi:hypothetical protein